MKHPFSKVAILGPGLIGGSIALALRDREQACLLWGRNPDRVAEAIEAGLSATSDLAEAVRDADLIILAVPVGVMDGLGEQLRDLVGKDALVTDVGSVKALPHEIAARHGLRFIGSHPMAGSEQTGLGAARGDLFEGAACVLTDEDQNTSEDVARLGEFWESVGCRIYELSVADHDRAVARISHLPHAMAVLTASAGLKFPDDVKLAAGGFRDTTRVASGDPKMWAEIMTENRVALIEALSDAQKELGEMLEQLSNSDQKSLEDSLLEVKNRKANLTELS